MVHPQLWRPGLNVKIPDLRRCKERFLRELERDSKDANGKIQRVPEPWLQKFECLVRPLLNLCVPQDVIVLSPCGLLHGIPLHAVVIDKQPLICCNSVVYTTGMRSIRYSYFSRASLCEGCNRTGRSCNKPRLLLVPPHMGPSLPEQCPKCSSARLRMLTSILSRHASFKPST